MSDHQIVLAVVLFGLLAVALFLHLPPRRAETRDNPELDPYDVDAASREDDRNWLGGFIYNNPDDPNLFVPKRFGIGWTVNFGHPRGKMILVAALLLILVLVILGPITRATAGSVGYHPSGGSLLP